jgi:hypothetical protein
MFGEGNWAWERTGVNHSKQNMIMKILTDSPQVNNRRNANLGVEFRVADARDLKKLRAVQRTSCEDDLLLRRDCLASDVVGRGKLENLW